MSKNPKKYLYHLDLLRFIFSLTIVYFHTVNSNIIPFVTDPKYRELGQACSYACYIVVCFFVLSGFFLYRSFRANPGVGIWDYILGRVARLWPILMTSTVLNALLSGEKSWQRVLIDGMFLQCTGLSLEYKGILWYVSSLFFASIFFYAILRSFSQQKAGILIALLSYFSIAFVVNYYGGAIGGRETVFYVLNMGMVRGVGFIGTGILAAMVLENLQKTQQILPLSRRASAVLFGFRLLAEISAALFLYFYFLQSPPMENHLVMVLVFVFFLLSLAAENSPAGNLFNRKFLGTLGKYAYSIYAMQEIGFLLLRKTLWNWDVFVSNVPLALTGSVLFCTILGVATYHLIEKPCIDAYLTWNRRYTAAKENT